MSENIDYIEPFRTTEFGYTSDSIVDMEVQPFYDGSVNIITTSEGTIPRIVNSRQRFENDVELIVRKNDNFDNVYSDISMDKSLLIPRIGSTVVDLTFNGVKPESGKLLNGGYKYYFRFKTSDGIESSIIEESRLVTIHSGTEFGKASSHIDDTLTRNSVQFTIDNIDTKVYKYVSVYYTRATGQVQPTVKTAYHINRDYEIIEVLNQFIGSCEISHTGFESESVIDISELTIEYSPIESVATLTQENNRLLLGNLKATSISNDLLKTAALNCYVLEEPDSKLYTEQAMYKGNAYTPVATGQITVAPAANGPVIYLDTTVGTLSGDVLTIDGNTVTVIDVTDTYIRVDHDVVIGVDVPVYKRKPNEDTYADPNNVYHKLGYFPGETYEFAINFVFENGSVSEAHPIMGHDYTDSPGTFDINQLGDDIGWLPSTQNSYGVVRMKDIPISATFTQTVEVDENLASMNAHSMHMDTSKMVTDNLTSLQGLGVVSYFISRRKRLPDMLMEGLVTLAGTASLSAMHPTEMATHTFGMYTGYGLTGSLAESLVLFPLPGSAMPVSSERLNTTYGEAYSFDGILYAPLADANSNKYYAFYSPDITSDTATSSLLNTKNDYNISISSLLSQSIAYTSSNLITVYTGAGGGNMRYAYNANPHRFTTNVESYITSKIQSVGDATRAFSSMSFTGKLDRQMSLALHDKVNPYESLPSTTNLAEVITRAQQATFSTLNGVPANNFYSSTAAVNDAVIGGGGSGFPLDVAQPSSQVPMTGVNYSPYIGLILENASNLTSALSIVESTASPIEHGYFTNYALTDNMLPGDNIVKMGAMARMYANNSGILTSSEWKDKYSIIRSDNYSAISKRFDIAYPVSKFINWRDSFLTGGDCYSGIYYQRTWRPGGIEGIPTASDPYNYISSIDGAANDVLTREGVNITNSGYAIGFPVRSSYNFALRSLEEVDDIETKLYGKERTYTSGAQSENIHGNRQPETAIINYSNIIDESILEYGAYDSTIPFIQLEYDNRVITSEISLTGEFENGYRDFKGLNFKDYDEDKGEIIALVSKGVYTYIIYTDGVSIIEVSERSAVTDPNTGANVYTDSANVLPPKSTPVLTSVGSQHLKSIMPTELGVFGVDAEAKKIWVMNATESKIISDAVIQSVLNQLLATNLENIITSYDVNFNEVTFTFEYGDGDPSKSLLYSTSNNFWYGTTDINKLYQFNVENRMLSLQKPELVYNMYFPVINDTSSDLFTEVGKTTAIDDRTPGFESKILHSAYIEFVIKSEQLQKFNLSNLIINGTGIPSSIDIISDNIVEYSVDISPSTVSGLESSTLPVHTNIYMQDATAGALEWIDAYTFKRDRDISYRTLNIGDKITIDMNGSYQQFTIANVTFNIDDDPDTDTVILSNPMIGTTMTTVYYGWKVPMRISLGESMAGKTKITIPTKKHADLLKGVDTSGKEQNYHVNYSNAKPYGRWIKIRLNFDGINQIHIESIISEIILRYS